MQALRIGPRRQRWRRSCMRCQLPTQSSSAVLREATPGPSCAGLKTAGLSAKRIAWEDIRWDKQQYIILYYKCLPFALLYFATLCCFLPFCGCIYQRSPVSCCSSLLFPSILVVPSPPFTGQRRREERRQRKGGQSSWCEIGIAHPCASSLRDTLQSLSP